MWFWASPGHTVVVYDCFLLETGITAGFPTKQEISREWVSLFCELAPGRSFLLKFLDFHASYRQVFVGHYPIDAACNFPAHPWQQSPEIWWECRAGAPLPLMNISSCAVRVTGGGVIISLELNNYYAGTEWPLPPVLVKSPFSGSSFLPSVHWPGKWSHDQTLLGGP